MLKKCSIAETLSHRGAEPIKETGNTALCRSGRLPLLFLSLALCAWRLIKVSMRPAPEERCQGHFEDGCRRAQGH